MIVRNNNRSDSKSQLDFLQLDLEDYFNQTEK